MRPSVASIALAALLPAVLAAPPAASAVLRGTLAVPHVPQAGADLNPYPGSAGALAGPRRVVRGRVEDAVVFLERLPAGADSLLPPPGPAPRLVQKDQAFAPRVTAVAVGTTVAFPNDDPIYHNVFSASPARRFDLGKYPKGASRSVTFHRPGLVNVYCDIHSNMEAFVLVLPHRAFARPDAAGRWALPEVPPGRYVVRAWHPDFPELSREVTLPQDGAVLELAF